MERCFKAKPKSHSCFSYLHSEPGYLEGYVVAFCWVSRMAAGIGHDGVLIAFGGLWYFCLGWFGVLEVVAMVLCWYVKCNSDLLYGLGNLFGHFLGVVEMI